MLEIFILFNQLNKTIMSKIIFFVIFKWMSNEVPRISYHVLGDPSLSIWNVYLIPKFNFCKHDADDVDSLMMVLDRNLGTNLLTLIFTKNVGSLQLKPTLFKLINSYKPWFPSQCHLEQVLGSAELHFLSSF